MSKKEAAKKISRRDLFKLAGAVTAGAVVTLVPTKVLARTKQRRFAMVIDIRRCTSCHACSVSCKSEFAVPLGVWRSWVEIKEKGTYPATKKDFLPKLCNHCDNPPCVPVCPVNATYVDADGTVLVDEDKCIGCRTCITACPYQARFLHPDKGVANKCDLCIHRVENGVTPACVNACPADARIFGDLNDPKSAVARLLKKTSSRHFYA